MTNNSEVDDDNGHGTKLAKILAENTNNKVSLLPIKAFDNIGSGKISNLDRSLQYAISKKPNIILLSNSFLYLPESTHNIIKEAVNKGIIIVAAAGNNNSEVTYPARFPEVIGVGASEGQKKAPYSNYGAGLEYIAPGVAPGVFKTNTRESGTSFSAARVAALVVNILKEYPSVTYKEIRYNLYNYTNQQIWSSQTGFGVIEESKHYKKSLPNLKVMNFPFNTYVPIEFTGSREYNFELPVNGVLSVSTSGDKELKISIKNTKGILQKSINGQYKLTRGLYVLTIQEHKLNSVKTLLLLDYKFSADQYEPNNSVENAKILKQNHSISGTFHRSDDVDFYKIYLQTLALHKTLTLKLVRKF